MPSDDWLPADFPIEFICLDPAQRRVRGRKIRIDGNGFDGLASRAISVWCCHATCVGLRNLHIGKFGPCPGLPGILFERPAQVLQTALVVSLLRKLTSLQIKRVRLQILGLLLLPNCLQKCRLQ